MVANEIATSLPNRQRTAPFPNAVTKNAIYEQYQLAGDAVLIAPVSSQIPCKQGILQGKLHSQPTETNR
jgi:hypothetical protein